MQTKLSEEFEGTPDGEEARGNSAQMRALRILQRDLSDVSGARAMSLTVRAGVSI